MMKKHGSNTENISQAVLRLGTKLWWLRAPSPSCMQPVGPNPELFPKPNARNLKSCWDAITIPPQLKLIKERQTIAYTGDGSNCRNCMDPPNPTVDMHNCNIH